MIVVETYRGSAVTDHRVEVVERELAQINDFSTDLRKGKYPVC
jgi:hypothetical protein